MADSNIHSQEICSPINSQNQTKPADISNRSILLNINNLILATPLTETPQIENISFRLLDYTPSIGDHGGHFKMAANLKVGFIFCR